MRGMTRRGAQIAVTAAMPAFAAIFANVLISRWIEARMGLFDMFTYWALTLNALPWLVVMLVQLYRMQVGGWEKVLRAVLAVVAGALAALVLVPAVLFANPLFQREPVSGPLILDTLALAYLLPGAMLLGALAVLGHLPRWVRGALAVPGIGLVVIYVALEIRRFWQGDILSYPDVTQPELYSYTVALMLTGAGLLYQAIARRSGGLRRLAMIVIGLTVAKVFLIDMSGLSGLIRVFSFLLLGLSLAGLAWLNRWAAIRAMGADAPEEGGGR